MNRCKERSQDPLQARLLPSSTSAGGLHSADYVAKGKAFPVYCKAQGWTAPHLPELFVLLQEQPLFPNGCTHKQ